MTPPKNPPAAVLDAVTGDLGAHIAASHAAMAAARVTASQVTQYVAEAQQAQDAAAAMAVWADEHGAPPPPDHPDWITYVRASSQPVPPMPDVLSAAAVVPSDG